jgi:hypothetical protein
LTDFEAAEEVIMPVRIRWPHKPLDRRQPTGDKMKIYLDLTISILTLLTLASGLFFAIYRFGLTRERFTLLRLTVDAKSVYDAGDLVLVAITIHLENKGDTRIDARRERGADGYLYNRGPDTLEHAGTLKIRAVPEEKNPLLFDWYSLPPLQVTTRLVPKDQIVVSTGDLEQINYLDEFQDPEVDYEEVDFWIEPHESYDLTVSAWLRPGIYAAKAYFLGPITRHQEEEYWSCHTLFAVGTPRKSAS